ncbi:unnamed protein product [Nippostrongylus brasiliensis]|uniref:Uncharacterized protein n=1 Tax=Nippostrongylus brasiliensis TaxID=27835 RepID=A0A0N4XNR6_NIPBR|nr:unnamed protein product [Nippostrongylus brasiliensis]
MQQPFVMTMSARRAYREFILLTTVKHPNVGCSNFVSGVMFLV